VNLDNAIQKHAEWKIKLRTAIAKKESMDAATIGKDNCCELGKWLQAEGKSMFGSLTSFRECAAAHTAFHTAAGKIATAINAKKYAEAEKMLGAGTAYGDASYAVGGAIIRLKKEAALEA
jgi:methyl-accepting chemotaxis protein